MHLQVYIEIITSLKNVFVNAHTNILRRFHINIKATSAKTREEN